MYLRSLCKHRFRCLSDSDSESDSRTQFLNLVALPLGALTSKTFTKLQSSGLSRMPEDRALESPCFCARLTLTTKFNLGRLIEFDDRFSPESHEVGSLLKTR